MDKVIKILVKFIFVCLDKIIELSVRYFTIISSLTKFHNY